MNVNRAGTVVLQLRWRHGYSMMAARQVRSSLAWVITILNPVVGRAVLDDINLPCISPSVCGGGIC
ncbi:hypothetical protein ACVXHA_14190 [Escherichia coli]